MVNLISFLREGTKCSFLQEAQLDKQLSQVPISHDLDNRDILHIAPGRLDFSHHGQELIDVGGGVTITIDFYPISQAKKVWESFSQQVLYTLVGTVAALTSLIVLKFSNVITARPIFVAWVAMAFVVVVVFFRALELFNCKPPFRGNYHDYIAQIIEFRKAIIVRKETLEDAKTLLPHAFHDRAAEFFTERERTLLKIPKEMK